MADKPTTQAGDRDPYFAKTLQTLQGQTSSLSDSHAKLQDTINQNQAALANQMAIINSRLANLERLAT